MADKDSPNTTQDKSFILRPDTRSVSIAVPEKAYSRRLIEYAGQRTREHNKMELIASLMAASVTALLVGAWGSLGLSLLAFASTLIALFFLHLFHSARALDKRLRGELNTLRTERDSIKEKLEYIARQKLTFTVSSRVSIHVKHDEHSINFPGIEPIPVNRYIIDARFTIRFHNEDENPRIVTQKIDIALFRIARGGNGKEKRIPIEPVSSSLYPVEGLGEINFAKGLSIGARTISEFRLVSYIVTDVTQREAAD